MLVGIDPGVHFMETDLQTEQVCMGYLGKPSKKKPSSFWTLSKSGIDPPPPHFGHP